MDPQTPSARVQKMLAGSGVAVVISSSEQVGCVLQQETAVELVLLDRDGQEIASCSGARLEQGPAAADAAYVIYTSGSTGVPKGVVVSHRSVHNYVLGLQQRLGLGAGASYAALSTVAADLGYTALYGALCSGGCLRLLPERLNLDAAGLSERLRAQPVDVLKMVPTHLRGLLQAEESGQWLPRVLVLGGEALEGSLVARVRELSRGCRIFNHYGPTETTIGVMCGEVGVDVAGEVSLGEPLGGVEIQVLDRWLEPVSRGGVGELYVGGACLALGYLQAGRQTAERFVAHVQGGCAGERLYRTGDRVRVGEGGELYFAGRVDEQVKIRGHRVELSEIVAVLRAVPGVKDAAVLYESGRLSAYVSGRLAGVKESVERELPEHMRPQRVVEVAQLPVNANGKLDRAALLGLGVEEPKHEVQGARDEREALLLRIWRELLRQEQIGIHENFFDCGGNSLLLIQAHATIRKELGVYLEVIDLFRYPTVARLAQYIGGLGSAQPQGGFELERGVDAERQKAARTARRVKLGQRRSDAPSSAL
jgi:amino acid adenylation domain-containing protein